MALIHTLESEGNFLFKYRGQIPVILFVCAVPVIYFTDQDMYSDTQFSYLKIAAYFLSFLGFLIRAYTIGTTPKNTSGRNTAKQIADVLNSTGIYSTVRHPLYLGNFLMWIGIVLYTLNIWFVVAVVLAYWLYYERIMFAEERFLERKFGQSYVNWSKKAPAFFPSFKNYTSSTVPFSIITVLRREYSGVGATIIGFLFVDYWRNVFDGDGWMPTKCLLWVLGGTIFYVLLFRSLKHYTKVLSEADRS